MSLLSFFSAAPPSEAPERVSTLTAPYNAETYLDLPHVYNNEPAGVHPDVWDFGPDKKWNGYRYWMAWTPYNRAGEDKEDPSVAASNAPEGPWVTPPGATNPIFPYQGAGYNADTEIVYDRATNRIGVLWRSNALRQPDGTIDSSSEWWSLKWSSDGATWSERIDAFPPYLKSSTTVMFLSPAMLEEADGTWKMWYCRDINLRTAPSITGPWSAPVKGTVTGLPTNAFVWHINMIRHRNQYRALLHVKGAPGGDALFPATSVDGLNFKAGPVILQAVKAWEGSGLYRSAFLPADNGADYDIWYSAQGSGWRIAHTRVPQRHWTEIV